MLRHWLRQTVACEDKIQKVAAFYKLQHEIYKQKTQFKKKKKRKTKNQLTEIMTSVLGYERLAETTNIRVVELFQNAYLSPEILQMVTILTRGSIIIVVVVRVGPAKFLRMYNLDRPPVARGAGHGLHNGGERASTELVRHIVVCVDAGEFVRSEVSIDVSIVFERILLLHRRAERDFVPVAQDTRMSFENARSVDLCMLR